jgi:uncharacterized protein YecE (DUF72 family)
MNFFLGCAIWAYKEWVGELYPPKTRAADFLRLYSRRFTTVEGNTTFYSVPDRQTVQRWAAETPEGFHFCLKLPKGVTHQGTLTPQIGEAIAFLHHMGDLGNRLGPLFAQLPPSYGPDQWEDLQAFLQQWPHHRASLALEVRHPHWFQPNQGDRLNRLLRDLGVGRVLLDTRPIYECPDDPQVHSERKKPQVPVQPVLTAGFTLIRFISHPDRDFNQPYLADWVPRIKQWLERDTQVYFFVHCPVEARSPAHARYVQQLLTDQGAPVPPLPWDAIAPPPTQLSLF